MRFRTLLGVLPLLLFVSACQREGSSAPVANTAASSAQTAPAPSRPPVVKPPDALASQNTNWTNLVADVMEFRRKGNTLTAVVRIRNVSADDTTRLLNSNFSGAYVLDEAQGKKYEVLKDEAGGYITSAGGTTGMGGGGSIIIWMKFPAPPSEVTKATLTIPETLPFEDLMIQTSGTGSAQVKDPAPWDPAVQAVAEKAAARLGAATGLTISATILKIPELLPR